MEKSAGCKNVTLIHLLQSCRCSIFKSVNTCVFF